MNAREDHAKTNFKWQPIRTEGWNLARGARNKQFSMMSYPNRTHSIKEGANITRHLFTLMTSFLETHLWGEKSFIKPGKNAD